MRNCFKHASLCNIEGSISLIDDVDNSNTL